jgi:hypothetical protein
VRTPTPAEWQEIFDARGNDPRRWRGYAYDLLESSAALLGLWSDWQRGFAERAAGKPQHSEGMVGYHVAASMLRGMACECLLKALGLERGKFRLAQGGRFVPIKELRNQHNLVRLAELVGFALECEAEERALRGLQRSIVAGRYPIVSSWEAERRHDVEGPPRRVELGIETDRAGDNILKRLLGAPLPKRAGPNNG